MPAERQAALIGFLTSDGAVIASVLTSSEANEYLMHRWELNFDLDAADPWEYAEALCWISAGDRATEDVELIVAATSHSGCRVFNYRPQRGVVEASADRPVVLQGNCDAARERCAIPTYDEAIELLRPTGCVITSIRPSRDAGCPFSWDIRVVQACGVA